MVEQGRDTNNNQQASTSFHPSLGNPGDKLYYVADNVSVSAVSELLRPEDAADMVTGTESGVRQSVVVDVPPSVVHTIFAHRQWRAGMLLADIVYASSHPKSEREEPLIDLAGKRVLELGAGTALPGILSAVSPPPYAPYQVVVTDYDEPTLVRRLRANVQANTAGASTRANVLGYIWGTNETDVLDLLPCPRGEPQPKFDTIFLADCLWDPLSHGDLLISLERLLARDPSARVYVVSGLHTGRETLAGFIHRALRRHGLTVVPWLALEGPSESPNDGTTTSSKPWKLRRSTATDAGNEDVWPHVLEAQLAFGAEVELDGATLSSPPSEGDQPNVAVSMGRRLTGVSRPFTSRERPEERKELGGVKNRNKWITFWSLAWTPEALQ